MAADRSGTTLSAVLPEVSAEAIQAVLEPAIDEDALLVTDGAAAYPRCAADLGISHETLNQSAGERSAATRTCRPSTTAISGSRASWHPSVAPPPRTLPN